MNYRPPKKTPISEGLEIEIEFPELEPLKDILVWQCPEFWQQEEETLAPIEHRKNSLAVIER